MLMNGRANGCRSPLVKTKHNQVLSKWPVKRTI